MIVKLMFNSLGVLNKMGYKISFWGVGNISYLDLDGGYIHMCMYIFVYLYTNIVYLLVCIRLVCLINFVFR